MLGESFVRRFSLVHLSCSFIPKKGATTIRTATLIARRRRRRRTRITKTTTEATSTPAPAKSIAR